MSTLGIKPLFLVLRPSHTSEPTPKLSDGAEGRCPLLGSLGTTGHVSGQGSLAALARVEAVRQAGLAGHRVWSLAEGMVVVVVMGIGRGVSPAVVGVSVHCASVGGVELVEG